MDGIKILHTADVHIGAPFAFLGERGGKQREAVRETFFRVASMAAQKEYDILIIAGDLFDDGFNVSQKDLLYVISTLSSVGPKCHVVILPGSHDYWAVGSVYEREEKRFEAAGKIYILAPEKNVVVFPELSVALHGGVLTSSSSSKDPTSHLVPDPDVRWNILVAHGSVMGASAAGEPEENPIDLDGLRDGFDYVALGHWHSFREISSSRPPVIYSGAPELIARDQEGAGKVVSVEISNGETRVEDIQIGSRMVRKITVDYGGLKTTEELTGKITGMMPPDDNLVLEVSLTGIAGADSVLDHLLAAEVLSESYFSVRFKGKGPAREISEKELKEIPEDTVAGRYIRILLERIAAASEEEKGTLEEALQLGYQLFRGRNPMV